MPNAMNLLMTGLEQTLKNVQLPSGQKPIEEIKKATELDAGFLRKNPRHNVVSQETREWDGENSELGSQEVLLDVWTKNLKQDAGEHQLTDESLLEAIGQAIREQAGHLSGQPFGAGTDLVRIEPPIRELPDRNIFAYRIRLVYNVLWG